MSAESPKSASASLNGALIIDKPEGLTSHDVVARLRRILRTKKIGHTGTLDPFATGVLVMLVGKATRLARYLDKDKKTYEARLRFGFETETGDKEGDRRQETGVREEGTADDGQREEFRRQETGVRTEGTRDEGQEEEFRRQETGVRAEGTRDEGQEEEFRRQETGVRTEGTRDEGQREEFRRQETGVRTEGTRDEGQREEFRRQETGVSTVGDSRWRSEPPAVAGGDKHDEIDLPSQKELTALVAGVLSEFSGSIQQIPPMYSAKKVKGKKLYELAREGIEVERKPCDVTIYELRIIEGGTGDESEINVKVTCSAGTYVRTLAEDIGRRIGIGCHLSALRRTGAGNFDIRNALTIEELEAVAENGETAGHLVSMNDVVSHLPDQRLDENELKLISRGMKIDARSTPESVQNIRLTNLADDLVAIGETDGDGKIQPKVVFISE